MKNTPKNASLARDLSARFPKLTHVLVFLTAGVLTNPAHASLCKEEDQSALRFWSTQTLAPSPSPISAYQSHEPTIAALPLNTETASLPITTPNEPIAAHDTRAPVVLISSLQKIEQADPAGSGLSVNESFANEPQLDEPPLDESRLNKPTPSPEKHTVIASRQKTGVVTETWLPPFPKNESQPKPKPQTQPVYNPAPSLELPPMIDETEPLPVEPEIVASKTEPSQRSLTPPPPKGWTPPKRKQIDQVLNQIFSQYSK